MINIETAPLILLVLSIIGVFVAYLFGRKTKRFKWSEYISLIFVPVAGSLSLTYFYGKQVIYYFLICSVVGFLLEYIIGLAYHKTLNRRLWTYGRFSVQGYTSLLTFPMWGVAGIVFWLVSRSFGL